MHRLSLWLALCLIILPVALTAQAQVWCVSMPKQAAPCHHAPDTLRDQGPMPDCCRVAPAPVLTALTPIVSTLKMPAAPVFVVTALNLAPRAGQPASLRTAPRPPPLVPPPAPQGAPIPLRV